MAGLLRGIRKAQFFSLTLGRAALCAASRFTFFKVETL